MTILSDRFDRRFPYLRLSVTEACNFSCSYCLPNGYKKKAGPSFMNLQEIKKLVTAFAALGVKKIRLTGGEPTLRQDLPHIIDAIANTPGIETVAMTTNGYKLPEKIGHYVDAGLSALNVSLDSVSSKRFKNITGHDRLDEVLEGINKAMSLGLEKVKINAVLMAGLNDDEMAKYLNLIKCKQMDVRFIELMRTGDNDAYFNKHHLDPVAIIDDLKRFDWVEDERGYTDGPARSFSNKNYAGRVGFIAPYAKNFCNGCNRLRVSATGGLQLCLFDSGTYDLREYLSPNGPDSNITDMQDRICMLLGMKPPTHELHEGQSGRTHNLSIIGG